MIYIVGVAALVLIFLFFEYRFRKPDHLVLYERKDGVAIRTSRVYPRHFSLALPRAPHSFPLTVEATSRGNLTARVQLAATVVASTDHLSALIRIGGWNTDAAVKAAKELESQLQSYVKEFAEQYRLEELSLHAVHDSLTTKIQNTPAVLGIAVISLTVLSLEPTNPQISEALRQQEHARIMEQTEVLQQQARIAGVRSRISADAEIAALEHELEMKKYDLKKGEIEQESALADLRVEEELRRSRKRLAFDREELEVLKASPELLMLTPQAARLAEASQGLRNARTIVSLSPQDLAQGSELLGMFQKLIHNALESFAGDKKSQRSK